MKISKILQWYRQGLITRQEADKLLQGANREWQKQQISIKSS